MKVSVDIVVNDGGSLHIVSEVLEAVDDFALTLSEDGHKVQVLTTGFVSSYDTEEVEDDEGKDSE